MKYKKLIITTLFIWIAITACNWKDECEGVTKFKYQVTDMKNPHDGYCEYKLQHVDHCTESGYATYITTVDRIGKYKIYDIVYIASIYK